MMVGLVQKVFPKIGGVSNDDITKQLYAKNMELANTNKTLSLIRTIDALVLESHASLKLVCEHITEAITQAIDYPFVGLFTKSTHSRKTITLYGTSGVSLLGTNSQLQFSTPVVLDLEDPWFDSSDSRQFVSLENLSLAEQAKLFGCSLKDVTVLQEKIPLKTLYIVKLQARRHIVGLLVVGFSSPLIDLSESDTELIDKISDGIGVALDNKLLFEENQSVLKQLKVSNQKLKQMDETKDDFISMASHQLRTPLTSVKGYISMVLEEDAGGINDTQREMLGQAFFSSQRMVYLIADLLNVSRLKSGKFIIETKPIKLDALVEQEMKQLQEAATSRSLTLDFIKPDIFPVMMLDETKTRQIIMNFIDNAIYYTPAGGHVTVKLVDKPETIELRVEDNGIGVPKSEIPYLFTKFYRAANARKARPDGTGLGLFMAKKVIIAQGGALLFDTEEGKGSTFGFTLSKSMIAPAVKL